MVGKTGLWMYCITQNKGVLQWENCMGIHGDSPIFTVADGDFAAVVSREPAKKYQLVRDTLIAHQRVNEAVMQTHRVLPVKFCTIAEDEVKIINEVLGPKADEFRQNLLMIADKEEYGLRVRWKDIDKVFRTIGETDEKILEKKEAIAKLRGEQQRYELINIGHLVQEAIAKKNEATTRSLLAPLKGLSVQVRENNALGDAMILNAAFLVAHAAQADFDRAIDALGDQYEQELQFKYVGPVPPFNFIEIVIHWKEEPFAEREEKYVSAG